METTYVDYSYQDLLTGKIRKVKAETPTTLIHILHPDKNFQVYGNLAFRQVIKGNNLYVPLEGRLSVQFKSMEGKHQVIDIQLPSFVHTNYFYSGQSYKYMHINSPLVVRDKGN